MLSSHLERGFAALGVRLKIVTQPKGTLLRVCVRQDQQGDFVQLELPRLSRKLVMLSAVHPRRKQLLLRLGSRECHAYVLVETRTQLTLRTIKRKAARLMIAGYVPVEIQRAA